MSPIVLKSLSGSSASSNWLILSCKDCVLIIGVSSCSSSLSIASILCSADCSCFSCLAFSSASIKSKNSFLFSSFAFSISSFSIICNASSSSFLIGCISNGKLSTAILSAVICLLFGLTNGSLISTNKI